MKFKLLGILLLTISCGKQVNIDHTALKEASKLSTSSYQSGIVTKAASGTAYLQFNNNPYQLSDFSSAIAKNFFESASGNINVKFLGEIQNGSSCKASQESFKGECIKITDIYRN